MRSAILRSRVSTKVARPKRRVALVRKRVAGAEIGLVPISREAQAIDGVYRDCL